MNSPLKIGLLVTCLLGPAWNSPAVTVNDGTTTNNLIEFSNSNPNGTDPNGTGAAVDSLTVNSNGLLVAAQSPDETGWALRTVWYASTFAPTNGVYTVSSDFQPAADYFANRGGVMGWLSLASSNGIALQ